MARAASRRDRARRAPPGDLDHGLWCRERPRPDRAPQGVQGTPAVAANRGAPGHVRAPPARRPVELVREGIRAAEGLPVRTLLVADIAGSFLSSVADGSPGKNG